MTTVRRYEIVDSTNKEAERLAAAGEDGPVWVVAERQTGGYGRRGRVWVSESGNLFATLLLRMDTGLEICAQASFVAALAVGDLVASYAPRHAIALKWPNDVLLDGHKVAGVLLETTSRTPTSGAWTGLLIGVGINLASHPADTEFPAISIATATGQAPSLDDAHGRLAVAWDKWYDIWRRQGFVPVREAWLARAAGLGEEITVRLEKRQVVGIFEDLDEDGALLLRSPGGAPTRIASGDIFFQT